MKTLLYTSCFMILATLSSCAQSDTQVAENIDYAALSKRLVHTLRHNGDTRKLEDTIHMSTLAGLRKSLDSKEKKLAFWINVYNSYILIILREQPDLYEDRRAFFKRDQILIGGKNVSFEKIEHGVLRHSKCPIGLGYFPKLFPGKWEKKLRVDQVDYRIHFALNCGAKSCPPVVAYDHRTIDEELDIMTHRYISQTSTFYKEEDRVVTTPLFSWFRGDFGGLSGIKQILIDHNIIPQQKINLDFGEYDWTLDLDNFTTLTAED